jgi:hypothetical protein
MYDVIYLNVITAGSPIHARYMQACTTIPEIGFFTRINPRKLRNIGRDVHVYMIHIKRPVLVRLSQFYVELYY